MKICQQLITLRTPPVTLGSEEERARRKKNERGSQFSLMELTRQEALKLLHEGHFDLAIPAALQSLRFSIDFYGQNSIDLVPSYLLLGEACVGLSRFKQAEEYLSLAKWAVLKKPDCSNSLKSNLYRNFGKLYFSQGKYQDALYQLANDIYFASLDYGPEHTATVGGYFYMGNIFLAQGDAASALAMYARVVQIWQAALSSHSGINTPRMDEAQQTECQQMMIKILSARESSASDTSIGEAHHVLALISFDMRQYGNAVTHAEGAYNVLMRALGPEHPSTIAARSFYNECTPYAKDSAVQ